MTGKIKAAGRPLTMIFDKATDDMDDEAALQVPPPPPRHVPVLLLSPLFPLEPLIIVSIASGLHLRAPRVDRNRAANT